MSNLNVSIIIIILSIVVHAKCVGESEEGFERKRFDLSLQTCLESFEVHTDMIIRTNDSRAMGAKYLNEAEVNGREECQKLCCETDGCDVYIFEQKLPESCYLFHCGSPENFKCKFTQHKNYTSAILTLNNHLIELENQIKLTKHEEELNSLRKIGVLPSTASAPVATTTKVPDVVESKIDHSTRSRCSRYQFECRGSGECIAIYNACDGIPQCSDGSDEAPELDCPTLSGTSRSKLNETKKVPSENLVSNKIISPAEQEVHQQVKTQVPYKSTSVWQQNPSSVGYVPVYGMSQPSEKAGEFPSNPQRVDPQQQLAYQARIYGREGEALAQQYPLGGMRWQSSPVQHQEESSHIFNHKGNGLVPESSDRYTNRKDLPERIHHGQIPGPYASEYGHPDYLKYGTGAGMNNNGYYGPVYYPNNIPMRQQQQQQHVLGFDETQRPGLGMYGNGMSAPGGSDYYYEDPQLRARVPALQDPRVAKNMENGVIQVLPKSSDQQATFKAPSPSGGFAAEKPKMTESVKKTLENVHYSSALKNPESKNKAETTTSPARTESSIHGIAAELSMTEVDADVGNDRPSGAILSLTLGMCITAIMIALVGCRLRVVRRRMRRSSKSPYAHDADFLVNGMYL